MDGERRRAKSLRIGVHHADGVVWGPVYRRSRIDRSIARRDDDERLVSIRPRSRGERRSLRTLHGGETDARGRRDAPGEEASRVVQAREREALHVRAVPAQDDRVRRRVPHARRAAAPSARTSSSPTNRSKLMKV